MAKYVAGKLYPGPFIINVDIILESSAASRQYN